MLFRSNDTATTEIYTECHTLSLHDALPIFGTVFAHATSDRAAELGGRASTAAGQADVFVARQQHAFQAAIVVTALALVASLALIRVNKVAPPTGAAAPALAD